VKTAKTLKKIIKNHTLPVTVQLINTRGHDIKLTGKMVLLRGDVELGGVRVAQSLVFCVIFCRSLFIFLPCFI
jgi:uncharacterized ubiquitin-like protein YukD